MLSAMGAQLSDQPLCNNERQRGGDHPACDTHLLQAHQRFTGGIGMQRRKNQMAGLRCFKGYFGRFAIADFTHHDNVGILAQQST